MPNKQIENKQADSLKVQLYGNDRQSSPLIRQGFISITGIPSITSVNVLNISGTYAAQVTLLNLSLSNAISSVSSLNRVPVTGGMNLTGWVTLVHSTTQISQSQTVNAGLNFTTDPIDISPYKKFAYYIQDGATNRDCTYRLQLAPSLTSPYYTVASVTTSNTESLRSDKAILTTTNFLRYARLFCDVGTGSNGLITIIFQAQR